ncbi:uncharacterized protein LOC133421558 [Cololabis saira]|uniref:uncharacterized protein LOC133421558 n=1 Tax=Cololabis saira TaxID=129043 RepID=UPI002AD428AF|nr:uncharacterized protein LOC133421558 [Cololabis saira]
MLDSDSQGPGRWRQTELHIETEPAVTLLQDWQQENHFKGRRRRARHTLKLHCGKNTVCATGKEENNTPEDINKEAEGFFFPFASTPLASVCIKHFSQPTPNPGQCVGSSLLDHSLHVSEDTQQASPSCLVSSSSAGLFFLTLSLCLSVRNQQKLSQDGRQRRDAGPPEPDMGQAERSAQRPPFTAGSLLHPPSLHLDGPAGNGADLCELLLLLLLS